MTKVKSRDCFSSDANLINRLITDAIDDLISRNSLRGAEKEAKRKNKRNVGRLPMLVKLSIEEFSRVLGSNAPAPGGGSVAALSGALGADLVSMVCRLSIGRKEYEQFDSTLTECLEKSVALSGGLLRRIDLDTEAFNGVMAAFKLPKETDEDKKARTAAIQSGYKEAVQSPLGIAKECRDVLHLTHKLIGKSNSNALSDLGVASQQAFAGLEGAIMIPISTFLVTSCMASQSKILGEIFLTLCAAQVTGKSFKLKI